jgi:hypothetical protein
MSKKRSQKCAWFADRGRKKFLWLLGPSTTPRDLETRLTAIGARPDAEDPVWAGMVLSNAPPRTAGIDVRRVKELGLPERRRHRPVR